MKARLWFAVATCAGLALLIASLLHMHTHHERDVRPVASTPNSSLAPGISGTPSAQVAQPDVAGQEADTPKQIGWDEDDENRWLQANLQLYPVRWRTQIWTAFNDTSADRTSLYSYEVKAASDGRWLVEENQVSSTVRQRGIFAPEASSETAEPEFCHIDFLKLKWADIDIKGYGQDRSSPNDRFKQSDVWGMTLDDREHVSCLANDDFTRGAADKDGFVHATTILFGSEAAAVKFRRLVLSHVADELGQMQSTSLSPNELDHKHLDSRGTSGAGAEAEVEAAITSFTRDMTTNNSKAIAMHYAPIVDRYFLAHELTRDQVRRSLDQWFGHGNRVLTFKAEDVHVSLKSADEAEVELVKRTTTSTATGEAELSTEALLTLKKGNEGWEITSNRDLKSTPR